MAPIPVYSASPIHAAKASGATPQANGASQGEQQAQAPVVTAAASDSGDGYPPAQPGARPSMPEPTGTIQQPVINDARPTPTQALSAADPPAPQPGAVPSLSDASNYQPSPPQTANNPQTSAQHYPSMNQPPETTAAPSLGYVQNHGSGLDAYQRSNQGFAGNASVSPFEGPDEGMWDTAKKWATAAGSSLAAAESEVWKRINKD